MEFCIKKVFFALGAVVIGIANCGGYSTDQNYRSDQKSGDQAQYCPDPAGRITYTCDVKEIISRSCTRGCHPGGFSPEGSELTNYEKVVNGKTTGKSACPPGLPFVVKGKPEESFIIEKINDNPRCGQRMPFSAVKLPQNDIDTIKKWISQGAVE